MIKGLLVGCSLLFVMCSGNIDVPLPIAEETIVENYSTFKTGHLCGDVRVQEIEINNQKYILTIGYNSVAICPSKNE